MRISDYTKKDIRNTFYALLAFLVFCSILICFRTISIDILIVLIFTACAVLYIQIYLGIRYYVADENKIYTCLIYKKRGINFKWDEFKTFAVYRASYTRFGHEPDIIVLSKKDSVHLPKAKTIKSIVWYWQRYHSLVVFKFTPDRYEYIRQFCDLPLIDNR